MSDLNKFKINDKVYHYMLDLFNTKTTQEMYELLASSEVYYDKPTDNYNGGTLFILTDPIIFKKYQYTTDKIAQQIRIKFEQITFNRVRSEECLPNLDKFQIIGDKIVPVQTIWEEINSMQESLLSQVHLAKNTIDFNNIGNTSRNILQKLAEHIYKPERHSKW